MILFAGTIAGTVTIAGEAAANPDKIAQCNRLSSAINKILPIAQKFIQSSDIFKQESQAATKRRDFPKFQAAVTKYASSSRAVNQQLTSAIETVSAVKLQDQTLVSLRNQSVQVYSRLNQGMADLTTSLDKVSRANLNSAEGLDTLQQSVKELELIGSRMSPLSPEESEITNTFNRYCAAK